MSPLGMLPEMLQLQAVHEQQERGSLGLTRGLSQDRETSYRPKLTAQETEGEEI